MSSIVRELQRDSMNSDIRLSNLFRKALFVAKKLKIEEFEDWINLELNGYHGEEIPNYRQVRGSLKYFNPYYGFLDYNISIPQINDSLSIVKLRAPIAELEDLIENSKNEPLVKEISPETKSHFLSIFNVDTAPEKVFISPSALRGILDNIRNLIFEWSMKLEEDGILGENFDFNQDEKEIANQQSNTYNTIISGSSNIQIGENNIQNINEIDLEEVKGILTLIKNSLNSFGLNETDKDVIEGELVTMDNQVESQNPNPELLKESLKSIRNILEGFTSSAAASILIPAITKIVGF